MAGCGLKRFVVHLLFSAIRSELALLVRLHAADCSRMVFRKKFKAPMAAQPLVRLCLRHRVFYSDICLAGFTGSSVSKCLAPRVIVSIGDLPRNLFRVLGLVCWLDYATQFPGVVAKFAVGVFSCVRMGGS